MLGLAVLLWFLRTPVAEPVDDYHIAMGTMVRMTLYASASESAEETERFVETGRAAISAVEQVASHYDSSSELSQINRTAADGPVTLSPTMLDLWQQMAQRATETEGRFDPALGALTRVWGFPEATRPPAPDEVGEALAHSGLRLVQVVDGQLRFARPGVRLDLGAAAKGYAVDQAVVALQRAGVPAGMIEAGGDIRFWGRKPDGRPWRFGVQHPRVPEQIVVVDDIGLPALATSGDYEQVFEFEGTRFHHLLDPETGNPARRAVSATVWTTTAAGADMLATAAFIGGPAWSLQMAAGMDSVEVLVFYEEDGNLRHVASPGVRDAVHGDTGTEGVAPTLSQ